MAAAAAAAAAARDADASARAKECAADGARAPDRRLADGEAQNVRPRRPDAVQGADSQLRDSRARARGGGGGQGELPLRYGGEAAGANARRLGRVWHVPDAARAFSGPRGGV